MHYDTTVPATTQKAKYIKRPMISTAVVQRVCDVYFHGKPSGLVMTSLRPSVLMVAPELASRITSVGIPVTLYLSPSLSYIATRKV